MIYLSPTETQLRSTLTQLDIAHANSYLCELNGVDILVTSPLGFIGYQRKTLPDLFASLNDGRLAREIAQIRGSRLLYRGCLIVEYDPRRVTTDGTNFLDAPFSKVQLRHLVLKCQLNGILVFETSNTRDTAASLLPTTRYLASDKPANLTRPKPATDTWGRRGSRDWGIHVLQSFSNIGPKTAALIYDHFKLPLRWTITLTDLTSIPGIGKVTAERLLEALSSTDDTSKE